jgi:tetratricopeptide (TPR) repeat protein
MAVPMQLLFAAWLLSVDAFLLRSRPSCVVRSRAAISDDDFRLRSSETVSLKDMWDRALTLQRAGQLDEALDAYEDFLSAADQNGVPPASTAEALGNVGAIHLRRRNLPAARASLEASLEHRELGSTLANLAIAALQAGDVLEARTRARAARHLDDDPGSVALAERILRDIEDARSTPE